MEKSGAKTIGLRTGRSIGDLKIIHWTSVALILAIGGLDLYYGNSYAGFFENLWYVMGGLYIFAALVIAANIEPRFSQLAVFGYVLFLWSLWATVAVVTGTGTDAVAYADKTLEAILAVNMVLLIRESQGLKFR